MSPWSTPLPRPMLDLLDVDEPVAVAQPAVLAAVAVAGGADGRVVLDRVWVVDGLRVGRPGPEGVEALAALAGVPRVFGRLRGQQGVALRGGHFAIQRVTSFPRSFITVTYQTGAPN